MQNKIVGISDPSMQNLLFAGGKGASLSKLTGIDGINVPEGFIITTDFFKEYILPVVKKGKTDIKQAIVGTELPDEAWEVIESAYAALGDNATVAVRSSATAEDLPGASFAGQQDSFLNVQGYDNIKSAIIACFASLYNERAIAYRRKNLFNEADISMAVIVQRMIPSQVSGVMFTADPMSSDRYTVVVEAVEGLGEDLVSGRKTPVTWHIKNGSLRQEGNAAPPLEQSQIKALVQIGKTIESVYGQAQDIEWCYYNGQFYIVQARPITTLYPAPDSCDGFKRCYMSFAHMQMMTDVMLPLGVSFSKLLADFALKEVGGRLYIDITHDIKGLYGRKMVFQKAANLDPLMESALKDVVGRKDYLKTIPKGKGSFGTAAFLLPILRSAYKIYRRGDINDIEVYLEKQRKSLSIIKSQLEPLHGEASLDLIEKDQKVLYNEVAFDPLGFGMIMAAQFVQGAINKAGEELLGEKNIINRLSLSLDHNITSQMGLALGKIADVARRDPETSAKIGQTQSMVSVGEKELIAAWNGFMDEFGMRCPGEIDITKPRFWEEPKQLLPAFVNNIKHLADNHAQTLFEQGRKQSLDLAEQLIQAMREKHGTKKAHKLQHKINVFRTFAGIREYPKYFWIARYDIYKRSIMRELIKLADQGVIDRPEDGYYLYFDELREAVRTGKVNKEVIFARKKEYAAFATLTPPRVIFSDGEVPSGNYSINIPAGALAGLGVSSGIMEGRARVVEKMEEANILKGDILITKFTDPSWTPLFVSIAGLITEVGGMMTHGAVITREYGLPCVVGVVNATRLIPDGARIRLNGDEGFVEILG